jgi:phospholipid-translocating ATPase
VSIIAYEILCPVFEQHQFHLGTISPLKVILSTAFEEGHCYIDTKNLDGETNLKYKVGGKELLALNDYENLRVHVEPPHENLSGFKGQFSFVDENGEGLVDENGATQAYPLGLDHLLLRGCVLRNTEWVIGLAVYVGPDTKVRGGIWLFTKDRSLII